MNFCNYLREWTSSNDTGSDASFKESENILILAANQLLGMVLCIICNFLVIVAIRWKSPNFMLPWLIIYFIGRILHSIGLTQLDYPISCRHSLLDHWWSDGFAIFFLHERRHPLSHHPCVHGSSFLGYLVLCTQTLL